MTPSAGGGPEPCTPCAVGEYKAAVGNGACQRCPLAAGELLFDGPRYTVVSKVVPVTPTVSPGAEGATFDADSGALVSLPALKSDSATITINGKGFDAWQQERAAHAELMKQRQRAINQKEVSDMKKALTKAGVAWDPKSIASERKAAMPPTQTGNATGLLDWLQAVGGGSCCAHPLASVPVMAASPSSV